MRLVSFGADDGIPVDAHGSEFRLAPVMGPSDAARCVFVHLAAGGRVGAHPASTRQLFCVVAGGGWVAGADGRRHALGPFEGAVFEPGERHEAGTDTGLVAAVLEGEFELAATPLDR